MGKPKARNTAGVVFLDGDPPPPTERQNGRWQVLLAPLVKNPSVWAQIAVADTVEQASDMVYNLRSRKVKIPQPKDDWEFLARECHVYAIYRGTGNASVRRAKRKR